MSGKSPKVPALILYFSGEKIGCIPINQTSFLIGRDITSNLKVLDRTISREHARIEIDGDGNVEITDLSSTNGTRVADRVVSASALQPGDRLKLGRLTLHFRLIEKNDVPRPASSFWRNVLGRRVRSFSGPFGDFILPKDDLIYEFDPQAFDMNRDVSSSKSGHTLAGLRRIPRLQLIQKGSSKMDEEVTRLYLVDQIREKAEETNNEAPTFSQPLVRRWRIPFPWQTVEKLILPVSLVVMFTFAIGVALRIHTEKQVSDLSAFVEKNVSQVQESILQQQEDLTTQVTVSPKNTTDDMSFWSQVDQSPLLRYLALFLFLDELIKEEGLAGSLEESLARLRDETALQKRLPSIKSIEWQADTFEWPLSWDFLRESNLILFSEKAPVGSARSSSARQGDFRKLISKRLMILEKCVQYRNQNLQGEAVLGFTISPKGKASSIFVNGKQLEGSPDFWSCIRDQIRKQAWPKPESGQPMALIYSLRFAGPTKITF